MVLNYNGIKQETKEETKRYTETREWQYDIKIFRYIKSSNKRAVFSIIHLPLERRFSNK